MRKSAGEIAGLSEIVGEDFQRVVEGVLAVRPGFQAMPDVSAAALAAGADIVLVDNMTTADVRAAVRRAAGRTKIEISGGVTLDRLPELGATGADYVSAGALTHSAPAVDISFEIEPF